VRDDQSLQIANVEMGALTLYLLLKAGQPPYEIFVDGKEIGRADGTLITIDFSKLPNITLKYGYQYTIVIKDRLGKMLTRHHMLYERHPGVI